MVDITLAVMGRVAVHDLGADTVKTAGRFRRGDIVDGMLTSSVADLVGNDYRFREPITSPRWVFVHIRDVPNSLARRMRDRLITPIRATPVLHPVVGELPGRVLRRRQFRIPLSVLTAADRAELTANREITFNWSQVRGHMRRKIILSDTDVSLDDESTAVTDADLL